MKVHAIIISWPGVEENAARIAEQLQGHADACTVIYSSRDALPLSGAGEWLQVPDDWFFGRKFAQALQFFCGDVMLLLHADAMHDDWQEVLRVCRQQFERSAELGVWAPVCDVTHWSLDEVRLAQWQDTTCHFVTQTDCIVCAFALPVVERLKALDYECNNLGWGIDWAAIAYAYTHHLVVVQDTAVNIGHKAGTGYAKDEAVVQMTAFLQQLTEQEKVMYQLLNHQVIK